MTTSSLLWSVLFGALGSGYFLYGKKQRLPIPLICGLLLIFFPYFFSSVYALVIVGVALAAIPFVVKG